MAQFFFTLRSSEPYYNTTKALKREDISALRDVRASKRGAFAVAMADPTIQKAVVEKGIEVAGKMVDKQLQIIDEAQQKAADFLKKEVRERKILCDGALDTLTLLTVLWSSSWRRQRGQVA